MLVTARLWDIAVNWSSLANLYRKNKAKNSRSKWYCAVYNVNTFTRYCHRRIAIVMIENPTTMKLPHTLKPNNKINSVPCTMNLHYFYLSSAFTSECIHRLVLKTCLVSVLTKLTKSVTIRNMYFLNFWFHEGATSLQVPSDTHKFLRWKMMQYWLIVLGNRLIMTSSDWLHRMNHQKRLQWQWKRSVVMSSLSTIENCQFYLFPSSELLSVSQSFLL